jgi:hypothetical protein
VARWPAPLLALAGCLVAGLAHGAGQASAPAPFASRLLPQQKALLDRNYPGARIVAACSGNFSGQSGQEKVLALTLASHTRASPARVGLVLEHGAWTLHDIDKELLGDSKLSRHFPLDWAGTGTKCSAAPGRDPELGQDGKPLGRSLFRLGAGVANACFATSEEYNNWDCVAFSPRERRFRLWYQQVFAD